MREMKWRIRIQLLVVLKMFASVSDASFTLKDASFNIPKGQWTSIVGHNGSENLQLLVNDCRES